MAKKHGRPWVHVDIDVLSVPDAARIIRSWINRHDIQVLNVAGSRASKDSEIYKTTMGILKSALMS